MRLVTGYGEVLRRLGQVDGWSNVEARRGAVSLWMSDSVTRMEQAARRKA
jgi:hypothetical protein